MNSGLLNGNAVQYGKYMFVRCLLPPITVSNMEAAHFSEKMVPFYHTAGRHILEGSSKIKDPDDYEWSRGRNSKGETLTYLEALWRG